LALSRQAARFARSQRLRKDYALNLIAGIVLPSAGTIEVEDTDLFALSEARS